MRCRRPPADDGYHLSEDLADRAIRYLGELRSVEPDTPFFLYFATGACHSPHHAPREWIDRYRGRFDAGWDAWRERTFARQQATGPAAAPARSSRPARRGCRRGTTCRPTSSGSRRASWSASPASSRTPTRRSAACSTFIEELGERDDTLVVARLRQRRLAPRAARAARSTTPASGTASRPVAASCTPASTSSAGRPRTTTTRGAGRWPATRRSGAGSARCTKAASPTRASCTGRAASPAAGEIRHQFAHAIDVLPTILELIGIDPPAEIDGVAQSPIEGTSFAYLLDAAAPTGAHTTQYFEMLGSRGDLPRGLEGGDVQAARRDVRRRARSRRAVRGRRVGAVPRRRGLLGVRRPRRHRSPRSSRSWSTCGGTRRAQYQVLPLDNRPLAALMNPRPTRSLEPRAVRVLPGRVAGARDGRRERAQPVARRSRPTSYVGAGRQPVEGVLLAQGTCSAAGRSSCVDGRLRYVHNFAGKERHIVDVGRRW